MKVTLFMAMSSNGIIARRNGDEDFLSNDNWNCFFELAKTFRNFVMGRKTFETVKRWDKKYTLNNFKNSMKIIVSNNPEYGLDKGYTLASSPKKALEILKKRGFSNVLLTGGSGLNSSFAKENLIDEIILNIESTIIGEGIPLFSPKDFNINLTLVDMKELSNNLVQLRYKVVK